MIRYTTLIAPVISLRIKPEMFISLLCIHVKIHCARIHTITLVTVVSVVSQFISQ